MKNDFFSSQKNLQVSKHASLSGSFVERNCLFGDYEELDRCAGVKRGKEAIVIKPKATFFQQIAST
jgi:hypothetical protein